MGSGTVRTVAAAGLVAGLIAASCSQDPSPEPSATPDQSKRVGRWLSRSSDEQTPELTDAQRKQIAQLEALGYIAGSVAPTSVDGVTRYHEASAWSGYNFFTSGHAPEAILAEMDGTVVHRWSYDYEKLWPDFDGPRDAIGSEFWRRAHLYPNGDILAIHEGLGMIKLDRDSNLLWEYPGRAHHEAHIADDGSIYVLTRRAHLIESVHESEPVLEDFITVLDENGKETKSVSVLEAIRSSEFSDLLKGARTSGDMLHTNSIELLDGKIADKAPEFANGNVLISSLRVHAVMVVDLDLEKVVWALQGDFRYQHHPKIIDNGNLILFDNRGERMQSTIYEFDVPSREVVWSYRGSERDPFYTKTCGTCYRLPNGNTLITESDPGRAFEVTKEGEIVWEYISPHRVPGDEELVASLFDVQRIDRDFVKGWLSP